MERLHGRGKEGGREREREMTTCLPWYGHVQYLFQEEVFVHEFSEAVCVIGVVGVNVELERVEVSTEKEQALR